MVKSQVRLYCLIARSARRAVIFRRGPSKHTLLLTWDLETDVVEEGQWFKGRIYERRCDLSPEGDLLLYFAASHRGPYYCWSAISRPPCLTALALWAKGNAWGGGGEFVGADHVRLNHEESRMTLAPGFQLPSWLRVDSLTDVGGGGEDDPVWSMRLRRDGWSCVAPGDGVKEHRGGDVWMTFDSPIVWEKPHPIASERYVLRMVLRGIHRKNGPWYVIDYVLRGPDGETAVEHAVWADWDSSGDLLYAGDTAVFRRRFEQGGVAKAEAAVCVADLAGKVFEPREPFPHCREWPKRGR